MTDLHTISAAFADLAALTASSVVSVQAHRASASGFFWRQGLVVTPEEMLPEDGDLSVILSGGERRAATIVGRDSSTDIALLRVEGDTPSPVSLAPGLARLGAMILAVGADMGDPIAAIGAVARSGPKWQSMRGGDIDARIDLDIRLRREAQGALVLDTAGQQIGMAVPGPRRRVLVIPAATIDRVAARLLTHGKIARGYLGLGLHPVRLDGTPASGTQTFGAMIMSVDAAGPAAASGLLMGDVIVLWRNQPISSIPGLLRGLGPDSVGQTVAIGLRRAGQPKEVNLTIGERRANAERPHSERHDGGTGGGGRHGRERRPG